MVNKKEPTIEHLQTRCEEAAIDLLIAVNDWHTKTGGSQTSYAEIFGLSVLVLEGINYQAVMGERKDEQESKV